MTIAVGDKLPDVKLVKATENGPEAVQSADYFKGKRVALFSVPGAFTPTCSAKHVPGYVEQAEALDGELQEQVDKNIELAEEVEQLKCEQTLAQRCIKLYRGRGYDLAGLTFREAGDDRIHTVGAGAGREAAGDRAVGDRSFRGAGDRDRPTLAAAGRRSCTYDRLGTGWSDDVITPSHLKRVGANTNLPQVRQLPREMFQIQLNAD